MRFAARVALAFVLASSLIASSSGQMLPAETQQKKNQEEQQKYQEEQRQRPLTQGDGVLREAPRLAGSRVSGSAGTPQVRVFDGTGTGNRDSPATLASEPQTSLSLAILAFGLLIILPQMGLLFVQRKGWGVNSTRMAGLSIVIIAGLFLITAGYSQDQIAPMIGLLGTIAGYLLGKSDESTGK